MNTHANPVTQKIQTHCLFIGNHEMKIEDYGITNKRDISIDVEDDCRSCHFTRPDVTDLIWQREGIVVEKNN